jgi:hypothetical protein
MYDQTRAQQPADRPPGAGAAGRRTHGPEPLVPSDERDRIARRLGHAVNTFASTPDEALAEAEGAFDEATAALVDALAERRRVLRAAWEDQDPEAQDPEAQDPEAQDPEAQDSGDQDSGDQDPEARDPEARDTKARDTKVRDPEARAAELRVALREYREITGRLLRT